MSIGFESFFAVSSVPEEESQIPAIRITLTDKRQNIFRLLHSPSFYAQVRQAMHERDCRILFYTPSESDDKKIMNGWMTMRHSPDLADPMDLALWEDVREAIRRAVHTNDQVRNAVQTLRKDMPLTQWFDDVLNTAIAVHAFFEKLTVHMDAQSSLRAIDNEIPRQLSIDWQERDETMIIVDNEGVLHRRRSSNDHEIRNTTLWHADGPPEYQEMLLSMWKCAGDDCVTRGWFYP